MNTKIVGFMQVTLAAFSWSFAGVICKWLPWNSFALNGFRALFATLLLGLMRGGWKVKITKGTMLGSLGVMLTSMLFMMATKLTSAANAIVLQYAMPVFVILFCWLFYNIKPSKRDIITAAFVLGGVILCSWEGLVGGGNILGDVLALLSAITYALVFFCSRLPDANASDYSYLGVLFCVPFALGGLGDSSITLNPLHWLAVLGMGVCLAGGYYFIARGLRNVSPTTAAILANLEPILNPMWVFIFLGQSPGIFTIIGAAVVLISATVYSILGANSKD